MKFTIDQHTEFDRILSKELEDNDGVLSHEGYESRVAEFLNEEHDAGRLEGLIPDLARSVRTTTIKNRSWKAGDAQQAFDLFQPDALLELGEGEAVRMGSATAPQLIRHRQVLDENFARQANAYNAKNAYLNDRIPRLWDIGGTLEDLEEG